jgi:cell division protein FtsB
MQRKSKSFWGRVYSSNIFIVILIVALILSVLKVGKELARRRQINNEIANLNQQLSATQLHKDKLEDLISYLRTDNYVEEQARLQLNLSKPGEKRVDLSAAPQPLAVKSQADQRANWQKWFDYFFK